MNSFTSSNILNTEIGIIEIGVCPLGITSLNFACEIKQQETFVPSGKFNRIGPGYHSNNIVDPLQKNESPTLSPSQRITELLTLCKGQLESYFSGILKNFTVDLHPQGTAFQQKVWAELQKVPFGETISYKELAIRVGSPDGCRAVGNAVGKNPLPILIPCHRVIASNGKLGGFSLGMDKKIWLLAHEK